VHLLSLNKKICVNTSKKKNHKQPIDGGLQYIKNDSKNQFKSACASKGTPMGFLEIN
jgi:hypothetical protein